MKVAIACETLEPGRSGVGDYSWRLAVAIQARGHQVGALAFADRHVTARQSGRRLLGGQQIHFSRLPASWSGTRRSAELETQLLEWQPDWTSLQFVPYSFHPRGWPDERNFPFGTKVGGSHHLMVHETWIGQYPSASLKARLVGWFQRRSCVRSIRAWAPRVAHTSCQIYQMALLRATLKTDILPMFGTIQPGVEAGSESLISLLKTRFPKLEQMAPEQVRLAGVFGSIYEVTGIIRALQLLIHDAGVRGMFLGVYLMGHASKEAEIVCKAVNEQSDRACALIMGGADDATLSGMFRSLHLGVTTTPLDGIGKSSAAASLRDHGLPVVACSRGAFDGRTEPPFYFVDDFVERGLLQNPLRFEPIDRVHEVAAQLLAALTSGK